MEDRLVAEYPAFSRRMRNASDESEEGWKEVVEKVGATMVRSATHFSNAVKAIFRTSRGKCIVWSEEQEAHSLSSTVSTRGGSLSSVSDVHSSNTLLPIRFIPSGSEMLERETQPMNTSSPNSFSDWGRRILRSETQSENTPSCTAVSVGGRCTVVR